MIRYLVIILLGIFLGVHPKEAHLKKLIYLTFINVIFILSMLVIATLIDHEITEIMLLQKNNMIVSALTILYALQLGLFIKLILIPLRTKKPPTGTNTPM